MTTNRERAEVLTRVEFDQWRELQERNDTFLGRAVATIEAMDNALGLIAERLEGGIGREDAITGEWHDPLWENGGDVTEGCQMAQKIAQKARLT